MDLIDRKAGTSLLEINAKLTTTNGEPFLDATLYRRIVDNIIYLIVTHSDVAYVVHLVSIYNNICKTKILFTIESETKK